MKKFILVLLLVITTMTSGCCIAQKVEAEEIVEEVATPTPAPVAESEQEKQYWEETPLNPLGMRKVKPALVPDEVWSCAVVWGMEYDIAPELICAIGYYESRWTNVISSNGLYYGMMQIHPGSHYQRMKRLGTTDVMDMSQNVQIATDLLRELFDEYEDPVIVLMKYHGEPQKNIDNYIKKGKITKYPSLILTMSAALEEVSTNVDADESVQDQSGN